MKKKKANKTDDVNTTHEEDGLPASPKPTDLEKKSAPRKVQRYPEEGEEDKNPFQSQNSGIEGKSNCSFWGKNSMFIQQ